MTRLSRALLLAAVAALAVPALANAATTTTRGIVVQRDAAAGSLVLASKGGALHRIQVASPRRFTMGSVLQVRGSKISIVGRSHSATVSGVVMRRSRHAYALAGNGAVLAVTTPTPPAAGQQVTATVQVTPTALSDDDGQVQVGDTHAPSAELHGTVLSQDATTLRVSVDGFPAGLSIALAGQTIPTLAVGTPIEARVTLGPDPANPAGIVLTLVSLHADNGQGGGGGEQGSSVKAEGQVTAVTEAGPTGGAPGSITILGEHGSVTFAIPAGFGPTGAAMGDKVEARGTPAATTGGTPTLVRLEVAGGDNQGDSGDDNGGSGSGKVSTGQIGAGTGAPVTGSGGGSDNSGGDD
jgi:hypothetical protein